MSLSEITFLLIKDSFVWLILLLTMITAVHGDTWEIVR